VGKTLNWIQFVIHVDNNTAKFLWQAWAIGATAQPTDPQFTSDPQQVIPPFPQPDQPNGVFATVPNNRLPKGSNLTIELITDPNTHVVTQANFTIQLPGQQPVSVQPPLNFPASIKFVDKQNHPSRASSTRSSRSVASR
jgi:hypothetical protein